MRIMAETLRFMVWIGFFAMVVGGVVGGGGLEIEHSQSNPATVPVLGMIIGGLLGLLSASVIFGMIALLFLINDRLEDIRRELRGERQDVIRHPARDVDPPIKFSEN